MMGTYKPKKKQKPTENFNISVTTLAGLEEVLAEELRALDMEYIKVGNRVVSCSGNLRQLYEANLWCRTAIIYSYNTAKIIIAVRKFGS